MLKKIQIPWEYIKIPSDTYGGRCFKCYANPWFLRPDVMEDYNHYHEPGKYSEEQISDSYQIINSYLSAVAEKYPNYLDEGEIALTIRNLTERGHTHMRLPE